jgi:hypothetical protein
MDKGCISGWNGVTSSYVIRRFIVMVYKRPEWISLVPVLPVFLSMEYCYDIGTGTVNGTGGYTFTTTVTDGAPDSFGIEIRKVSDGNLYYSAPAKNISGGDLKIQVQ